MKRKPFKMLPSRYATLRCDGKFVLSGRASYVFETFLLRRAAGIPGHYEIRADRTAKWHTLEWTIEEAEDALVEASAVLGKQRVERMRRTRRARWLRNLPVG